MVVVVRAVLILAMFVAREATGGGGNSKNTVDYLTQFGYLPQSETEAQVRRRMLWPCGI
jgi:hypothetical protein